MGLGTLPFLKQRRAAKQRRERPLVFLLTIFSSLVFFPFAVCGGQSSQSTGRYTVRGTVVNSITGEAIRGVLVQIYSNRQRSVLTGADGGFEFAEVPAGTVNLGVQKLGYFTLQAIQSPRMQASFAVSGPDQPPVIIKLVPEGVISGHVIGDGGEPVENFPVQLLAERLENGRKMRANVHSASTNEDGEFRLAELQPGKYFVFAGPSSQRENVLQGLQGGARGYVGTFYPDVSDIAAANVIEIGPGQRVEINLNLRTQPFHQIRGTLSGYPQNNGVNLQVTNAAGQAMPAGFRFDPRDGTFRTMWLPAGPYTLTAEMRDPDGQRGYFASQSVNLTADIAGVHLHLLPGLNIPVHARVERTRNDSAVPEPQTVVYSGPLGRQVQRQVNMPANVILTRQSGAFAQQQIGAQFGAGEDAPFELSNVPPGVYSVQVMPNGPWYVQGARSGSLNLVEQSLTVAPGSAVEPIEIVLRDDFAQLGGSVAMGADNDFAMVVAIPEEGQPQTRSVERARPSLSLAASYSTAIFEMGQLAPGTYRVLAVDRMDDFEYGNPDVLRKYLGKAREISLEPNQKGKIELELVHVGE